MKNKFSILLPVYNNAKYLKPCLESIKNFAYELVILEGGWNHGLPARSTDGTLDVIKEFLTNNPTINAKVIYYDPIEGEDHRTNTYNPNVLFNQIRAKQIAVESMTGDWMFMADSDEIYKPEDLARLDKWLYDYKITDEYFIFRMPAFVFYFNHNFGTREHFTRISRILESPCRLTWEDQIKPPLSLTTVTVPMDIPDDICFMYHYGYPSLERAKAKMNMWREDVTSEWIEEFYNHLVNDDLMEGTNYHLFAAKLGYGQGQKYEKFSNLPDHLCTHPLVIKEIFNQ